MNIQTVNTLRVAVAFFIALIALAIYVPYVGLPLAVLWLGIVFWQRRKQAQ